MYIALIFETPIWLIEFKVQWKLCKVMILYKSNNLICRTGTTRSDTIKKLNTQTVFNISAAKSNRFRILGIGLELACNWG